MDEVIKRAPTDKVLSMIGAGYLEDLICYRGELFVDRILENARKDRNWRFALGCVWPGGAENEDVKK